MHPQRLGLAALITMLIGVNGVSPQADDSTFIRVSQIDGLLAPNVLIAGDTVRFHIMYGNRSHKRYNVSNAFKIYSRESFDSGAPGSGTAEWPTTFVALGSPLNCEIDPWNARPNLGAHVDCQSDFLAKSDFGAVYTFNCFGGDARGSDTIGFAAAVNDIDQRGMPPLDSGVAFKFWFVTRIEDTGKVICIDSCTDYPPTNTWKWAPVGTPTGTPNVPPSWSGPHCFLLAGSTCCQRTTGNIDCSADDNVGIDDLTRLIDFLLISFAPLCCPQAANIDGSPDGGIDISDLSRLIDYLYVSLRPTESCL